MGRKSRKHSFNTKVMVDFSISPAWTPHAIFLSDWNDPLWECRYNLSNLTNQRVYQELVHRNGSFKEMITGFAAPSLPSFLPFYFTLRSFSIQRAQQSRSLEQANAARVSRDAILIFISFASSTLLHNVACSDSHLSFCVKNSSLVIWYFFWGFINKDLVLASTCFSNIKRLRLISFSSTSKEFSAPKSAPVSSTPPTTFCWLWEFGESGIVPGLSWTSLTNLKTGHVVLEK